MKTAMQELFEYLDDIIGPSIKQKFLEKEKEQIVNAYASGYKACDLDEALEINKTMFSGEQYYNQTYNQEETLEEWKSKFTHHCVIKANQNK